MNNTPSDKTLYDKVKDEIYNKYPKHSAYRSGLLVKRYKEEFFKKYPKGNPYTSQKSTEKKGLKRWFAEIWTNQRGKVGYKYKSDVYRPTVRINEKTPTTFSELTQKEISNARNEKLKKGRVKRFKKD